MICKQMTRDTIPEAFSLLKIFLTEDEYYLNSSQVYGDGGNVALQNALELFVEQPKLGFVWIAYMNNQPVGICVICFAISTSLGAVVAKLDDVFVSKDRQNQGIGSILLTQLKEELRRLGIRRIDTSVHFENKQASNFYKKNGFLQLNEERLSCLL